MEEYKVHSVYATARAGWSRLVLGGVALGILLGTLIAPHALYASESTIESGSDSGMVVMSGATTDTVIDHSVRPPVRERAVPKIVPAVEVELTVGPQAVLPGTTTRTNYVQIVPGERGRGIPYAPTTPTRGRFTPRERR